MSKLMRMVETAFRDSRRADALIGDMSARRALGADPETMLGMFELRGPAIYEEVGGLRARAERRDDRVREARRAHRGNLGYAPEPTPQ